METFESAAHILKTVGHPLRLKIIVGLIKQPGCVKDIWGCLEQPQAIISQHLAKLKTSGVIEGRRIGVEMHYTVTDPMVRTIVEFLTGSEALA